METKRRNRLVDLTVYLLEHPHVIIPLRFFVTRYHSAKPSISEDVSFIKETFMKNGTGSIKTIRGAAGGVIFIPMISRKSAFAVVRKLLKKLNTKHRYLPGGYVYMTDILNRNYWLETIGRILATQYIHDRVDVVMTIADRGAIAPGVAKALGVPFIFAQRHSLLTAGSTVNVNYYSSSNHEIHQLTLPTLSLKRHSHVLIVDDYLRGGSTVSGMVNLVRAFDCHLAGISVFADGRHSDRAFKYPYTSLIKIDTKNDQINASAGNYAKRIFNGK